MQPKKVVIDHDILGWANENKDVLSKRYMSILRVGLDPALPRRSFDEKVASYCKDNSCDLLTGDKEAYTHYFSAGIPTLQLTKYGYWKKGDKPIYLIEIVKKSED